jgi:hypothetical protein
MRLLGSVDLVFGDVFVNAPADVVVGLVRAVELRGEIQPHGDLVEVDAPDRAVEFHPLARELP